MVNILITRKIPKEFKDEISKLKDVKTYYNDSDKVLSKIELIKAVRGMNIVVSLLTDKIDRDVIEAGSESLKYIANYAVGFDNIDIEAAKEKNIFVTNTPDIMTQAVAEHAMALMLACARRIIEGDRFMREGKYRYWMPELLLGPEIAGKTIGIVGVGRIGQALAEIAYHGFGMKILYHDIKKCEDIERNLQADYVSLNHLLEESDFVSLHVPLLPETKHMIGRHELSEMKKTAVLINTSRGPVVDEIALADALEEKQIFAAGIDVYEFEPNPVAKLLKLNNIVMTPHIASATEEARKGMGECVIRNIEDFLSSGKIKNNVY